MSCATPAAIWPSAALRSLRCSLASASARPSAASRAASASRAPAARARASRRVARAAKAVSASSSSAAAAQVAPRTVRRCRRAASIVEGADAVDHGDRIWADAAEGAQPRHAIDLGGDLGEARGLARREPAEDEAVGRDAGGRAPAWRVAREDGAVETEQGDEAVRRLREPGVEAGEGFHEEGGDDEAAVRRAVRPRPRPGEREDLAAMRAACDRLAHMGAGVTFAEGADVVAIPLVDRRLAERVGAAALHHPALRVDDAEAGGEGGICDQAMDEAVDLSRATDRVPVEAQQPRIGGGQQRLLRLEDAERVLVQDLGAAMRAGDGLAPHLLPGELRPDQEGNGREEERGEGKRPEMAEPRSPGPSRGGQS
jgi:hypothetical protein